MMNFHIKRFIIRPAWWEGGYCTILGYEMKTVPSFTLHFIMINPHYIDEKEIISDNEDRFCSKENDLRIK